MTFAHNIRMQQSAVARLLLMRRVRLRELGSARESDALPLPE
jgi:hypothetical protein